MQSNPANNPALNQAMNGLPAPLRLVLDERDARAALAAKAREQVRGTWIALQRPPAALPLDQSQN